MVGAASWYRTGLAGTATVKVSGPQPVIATLYNASSSHAKIPKGVPAATLHLARIARTVAAITASDDDCDLADYQVEPTLPAGQSTLDVVRSINLERLAPAQEREARDLLLQFQQLFDPATLTGSPRYEAWLG